MSKIVTYWRWLYAGTGAGAGIRRYLDKWLIFHLILGSFLAWVSPATLQDGARGILLPLAGIFVGLSFAWGGNAQALLETPEIREMTEQHAGGFEEYLYTFQTAILFLLATLVLWGITGLGVFDLNWPTTSETTKYYLIESSLFFFASLAVRECWHVVLGAHWFLLARYRIKKANDKNDNG